MSQPFTGVRILDLTHVLAGPFCTYQLGLLGADIIKIEDPNAPDITRERGGDQALNDAGLGLTYQSLAANKRSVAIDLKTKDGLRLVQKLITQCDALVENFRPGKLADLGLGYDDVRRLNPRIIYCSITGFGQTSTRRKIGAYDNVIQALSGLMSRSGGRKTGASFVDIMTGQNAAFAVASALYRQQRDGQGCKIDCSMLNSALLSLAPEVCGLLNGVAADHKQDEPNLGSYQTQDQQIMIGAYTFAQHNRFWNWIGKPQIAALDNWPDIWAAGAKMRDILEPHFASQPAEHWVQHLRAIDVPVEIVTPLDQVLTEDAVTDTSFIGAVPRQGGSHFRAPMAGFSFAQDGPKMGQAPRHCGADTDDVLGELGLLQSEIDQLRTHGVITS